MRGHLLVSVKLVQSVSFPSLKQKMENFVKNTLIVDPNTNGLSLDDILGEIKQEIDGRSIRSDVHEAIMQAHPGSNFTTAAGHKSQTEEELQEIEDVFEQL